ncbi:hypothetical protein EZ428_23060 [Pedobacter frigiditerrae]|uniref:Uncharacterized protein n=1 Tax=Pedobacter frigiditerrae TaxID=2530452 RepID=A0A4R0MKE6_9SPHI|nr:hypothetical protein [Pedobacter frigiditerrae]TCC87079.1 hypothetical protein EZ428_23060 [Pedobacter frigiditerrae]
MKTYLSILALLFVSSIASAQTVTKTADTAKQQNAKISQPAPSANARISMNVTVPKQTQGATFGEKVNAGLHAAGGALAQGASVTQNPLYAGDGNVAVNPLYDQKAKTTAPIGPIKGVIVKGSKNN